MNWELPLSIMYCDEGGFRTEVSARQTVIIRETVEETMDSMNGAVESHLMGLRGGGEMPNEKSLLLEGWKSVRGWAGIVPDAHSRRLNDVGKLIKGSKVLIMGLAYKENVPDTRKSPVRGMFDQEEGWDGVFITGDCEQQTCILNLPCMQ